MPTHEFKGDMAWLLTLLAFYGSTRDMQMTWAGAVKEAVREEEDRWAFERYSEDCTSLDEHPDGNAYERLCMNPEHPYHRDSRPQCDRDLCPHLHPNRNPFRGVPRMPVRKVKGGYRYGKRGKVYASRAKAERQGRAIRASQRRREASGYSDRRKGL